MNKIFVLLCTAVAIFPSFGCSDRAASSPIPHSKKELRVQRAFSGSHPIKIVCTTGMVADIVRNVGGKHVEVDQLMGQDVDPHLYKATPGDMSRLARADAVFYSGLHLEGKMTDVLERLGERGVSIGVAEFIDQSKVLTNEEGIHDPHVWFDVSLWSQTIGVVRDVLAAFDPAHAADYTERAASYEAELAMVHTSTRQRLAEIPSSQRVLITSHDAFHYFGRAYDIEVKGIQGISTDAEAGVKDINDLVRFITQRRIKAVFVETSVNQRNMRALLEGCKSMGHDVVVGGELYSDAMGKDGTAEGTYAGMIRHNVETIVHALK